MPIFMPSLATLYVVTNSNLVVTSATQSLAGSVVNYGALTIDGITETHSGEVTPILAADSDIPVDYAILNPSIQVDVNVLEDNDYVRNLLGGQSIVSGRIHMLRPARTRWIIDLVDPQYGGPTTGRIERRVYDRAVLSARSGYTNRYQEPRVSSFTLLADVDPDTASPGQFFAASFTST